MPRFAKLVKRVTHFILKKVFLNTIKLGVINGLNFNKVLADKKKKLFISENEENNTEWYKCILTVQKSYD